MSTTLLGIAVVILAAVAILDLVVGVGNDAVNFLNSSIGSKVAPRRTILIIASIGLFCGVFFASGMMEVARKGIFHPQLFTMPELIILFLAVMFTDLLVLDSFNTHGLPTSTTVSIVFELLGAAVALAIIKTYATEGSLSDVESFINSGKALTIIGGILLSVVVAFIVGAILQLFARLLFTYDYSSEMKRFGGFWGALSFTTIALFILIKAAKGASFLPPEIKDLIQNSFIPFSLSLFAVFFIISQGLIQFFRVNIFVPIILVGTFSLALAFAANDLVNFIGVPLAGYHAYTAGMASSSPLTIPMSALAGKVPSNNLLLLICGAIMVGALWLSKKSQSVTDTEIKLSSQDDEAESFQSFALSRGIVRLTSSLFRMGQFITPKPVQRFIGKRLNADQSDESLASRTGSFDLLRASTNLMVASALVSGATTLKLPLSTTYVTFMVAMGTSFADQAWGRDSASNRIAGVLTVIGGWFFTAFSAFSVAAIFCTVLYYGEALGAAGLLALGSMLLWQNHHKHGELTENRREDKIYNLRRITDVSSSKEITFKQSAHLLNEMANHLKLGLDALYREDISELKPHFRARKRFHRWASIIVANIFKVLRLQHAEQSPGTQNYWRANLVLQEVSESYRDLMRRSFRHLIEHHKPLLPSQIVEIRELENRTIAILAHSSEHLIDDSVHSLATIQKEYEALSQEIEQLAAKQVKRIHDGESKTRLSILYFGIVNNLRRMSQECVNLVEVFNETSQAEGT